MRPCLKVYRTQLNHENCSSWVIAAQASLSALLTPKQQEKQEELSVKFHHATRYAKKRRKSSQP